MDPDVAKTTGVAVPGLSSSLSTSYGFREQTDLGAMLSYLLPSG